MSARTESSLALGLAVAAIVLAGCDSRAAGDPRAQEQLVSVSEVQSAGPAERGFTGLVAARIESNLTFRVAGKVTARLADVGQTVHAGEALMRLDRTDYEHAVVAQRGNVAAANAKVKQTAADEERYASLVSSGAVSKSAYDQAKAAADTARALAAAADAQLRVAENESGYATLVADADGVVMDALAEPGQFVAAGQVVMRLAHAGAREAAVYLPETLRPALGSTAVASLYGRNGRYAARLRQLSNTADANTRTFEARYVLDGDAAAAPLGATVTILIPAVEPSTEVAVPLGAVDDRGNGPGVWTVAGDSPAVSFRPVQLLQLESERAIVGGLGVGERIVALGGHLLHEGQRVRVAERDAALQ